MEPYEGREPYIFISYARKDAERVAPYLDALSGAGYRVWYDVGIPAGDDWLKTLLEKVENCAVFCPLFSEAFKNSRYCLFETAWAYQKTDKTIVSLYLDDLEKDNLGRLYRHLRKFQELPLHGLTPAQFAARLEHEQVFAPCKKSEWHKAGEIQWRLSADSVLEIVMNKNLPYYYKGGFIPPYQCDPVNKGSTAPWMPYRKKIVSVEIADDIDAIGNLAFLDCKNLTKALIGNGVTKIGGGAFAGCKSLIDVCIPDRVSEISADTFFACASLTDVRIPDSVTTIGDRVFFGCTSLTDVCIPDSVITIGAYAFAGCENLKSVEIPAGAKVGYKAFPNHTLVTRRDAPSGDKT